MVSGGLCFISSVLLIAQGAIWLSTTESLASLAGALAKSKSIAGTECCGGPLANLRGLASAGIVFACLEILAALGLGVGIGALIFLTPQSIQIFGGWNSQTVLVASPNYPTGIWLTYATGASAVGGAVIISMCVATLHLLSMLNTIATSEPRAASPNPAYAVTSQTSAWAQSA